MKKRGLQAFLAALLISSMIIVPTSATTLDEMKDSKAKAEKEAGSLQSQLRKTLDKINDMEEDLGKKQDEIEKAGEALEIAAQEQTEQYNSMKLRIKYMYEEGSNNIVEVIMNSKNFSDFINKAGYIRDVHSYDRKKMKEYEETTKKVEEMRNGLEEEYEQLQVLEQDLQEEKEALSTTLQEKQSEIASLDKGIQAELEARKEEERKAKEEAARQQAAIQAQQNQQNQQNQQKPNKPQQNPNPSQNQENKPSGGNNGGNSGSSGGSNKPVVPPQNKNGAAVVAYARQFLGNPYVLGGNSLTNGTDCSGFTRLIYAAFGVSLPRVDSAQALCGVEIPLSQAQAGDLICYYGHVGIYNGTGGLIHASSPSVGIVEFSSCQYRQIRCVRRVL